MSAESEKPEHTLVQPRLVAAVGLIALGGGLWVGLMLARTLIAVGFLISLACSVSVIWLYGKHLRAAYRAITTRIRYEGPPARELLIALGMVVVLMAVAISVFSVVLLEEPSLNKASVHFAGISQYKIPGNAPSINIQLHDAGNLDATEVILLVKGHVTDASMNAAMDRALAIVDQKNHATASTMRPTQDAIITLQDIKSDQWIDVLEKRVTVPAIPMTDAQWSEFLEAKHIIYVFFKVRYGDQALQGKSYWQANFCGYFVGTTALWHNCDTNLIDRVKGPRP